MVVIYCRKIIEYGFYALTFLVPLAFTPATFELFEFPKMILVYLLTILIAAAFLVKSVLVGKFNLKRTPLDLPILLYAVCYVLSAIFSTDRYTSIFGYYTRFNGGLLSLLCYITLYYIFVWEFAEGQESGEGKEGKREKFIKTLLLPSFFVSLYGILQHFGIDEDYWVQDVRRRVFSTLGQPNWLAAYLVMVLPVSLSLLLNIKNQSSKILVTSYWLLVTGCYTAFWFTYSLSGLLGFVVAILTFLVFLGKENLKQNLKPLLVVFLSWIIISSLTLTPTISGRLKKIFEVIPQVSAAETTTPPPTVDETGSTVKIRLAVWKGTLNLIKDHPFLGTGPETFGYSFLPYRPLELNQTAEWEFLYNKAHNEYLNLAATTGLLGLAAYLWIIGKFIFWNAREFKRMTANGSECANGRILKAGIFAGWVGVLVTNFFGFSVVVTSVLFWLYMALSVSMCPARRAGRQCVNVSKKTKIVLAVPLFFIPYSLFFILNTFRADVFFNGGEKFSRYGLYEIAATEYQKAIALNPSEPRYHRELASTLVKLGEVEEAESEAEIAYNLNPKNSLTVRSLISTYIELSDFDSKYQTRAEELITEAIAWQPTNPQLYYEQALILLQGGKSEEALVALQKALELKPDYQKPRELLGTFQ